MSETASIFHVEHGDKKEWGAGIYGFASPESDLLWLDSRALVLGAVAVGYNGFALGYEEDGHNIQGVLIASNAEHTDTKFISNLEATVEHIIDDWHGGWLGKVPSKYIGPFSEADAKRRLSQLTYETFEMITHARDPLQ